jgi:hypothetical protein
MAIAEGDPRHCGLCALRALVADKLTEAQRETLRPDVHSEPRELTRDEKIDWALGNLNASTNHKTTREIVAAAYDRMHPEG